MTGNIEQRTCTQHGAFEARELWRGKWSACHACEAEKREREREECAKLERQAKVESYLRASGIVGRYTDAGFDNYEATFPEQRRVLAVCRQFAESFEPGQAGTLWLLGPCGTGKTHLASAIIRHVIQRLAIPGTITTPRRIVRRLRATWAKDADETEADVLRDIRGDALFVLDEVGVSFGSEAELVQLYEAIDGRYVHKRSTLVASNLTPTQLKEALGDRVFDRLREGATVLTCNWPSYRGRQA